MTKPVDAKVDNLLDKLLDRTLSTSPIHNSAVDNAVLGKPGHLATLSQSMQTRPIIPYKPASQGVSFTRPAISANPTFHSTPMFRSPHYNFQPIQVRADPKSSVTPLDEYD